MTRYYELDSFINWKNRTRIIPSGFVKITSGASHYEWYYGYNDDGYNCFRLDVSFKTKLKKDYSSKSIIVGCYPLEHKSTFLFTLQDSSLSEVFADLFNNLVESVPPEIPDSHLTDCVFDKYAKWIKMFNKGRIGLDDEEQRGLIGELLYIEDLICKGFYIEDILNCWSGIDYEEVDFVFPEFWAEVKTHLSTSSIIKISSPGQLDHPNDGLLRVYSLSLFEDGLSLNDIYNKIHSAISETRNPELLLRFERTLEEYGYYKLPIYDKKHYSINDIRDYKVDSSFPKIRRDVKKTQMKTIVYSLIIDSLEEWRIK